MRRIIVGGAWLGKRFARFRIEPLRRVAGFLSVLTIAACVLPAAPATIRELAARARFATALLPASEAERRVMVLGWPERIGSELQKLDSNEPVDFVMLDPDARDLAVFTAARIAPRPVRLFEGRAAWEQRTPALLFRDDRAANAVPAPPTSKAATIVFIDSRRQPPMWIE